MAKPDADSPDLARAKLAGTFTGLGSSGSVVFKGGFNVTLAGTFVATVKLRRSFDGGATWSFVSVAEGYSDLIFATPMSTWRYEFEDGVLYSLECTAYTSGSIAYRLSC